jgi:hypothetical protein
MRTTDTYPPCSTSPHFTAAVNPFVSHSSPPSFHQFLSPVRRKKKPNRAPFAVENRKKRSKKVPLYQARRSSAVAQTKNTAVAPTTSTAAGKNSDSRSDEEHGCRANRAEEKTHREGSYTHSSISFHPGRTCCCSGGRNHPRFKFSASVLPACSRRREKTEKGPCNPREQDCLK